MRAAALAAASACLLVTAQLAIADRIIYTPESEEAANKYALPKGFLFGAATASYQVEGAWNEGGKGVNVFDHYFNIDGHNPDPLHNGNIAADMYHHVDEDIKLIEHLKLQIYRFSISWARVLPDGDPSNPNLDGVRYYKHLIKRLREINVEPLITLYHFDHPQALHILHDSWLGRGMIEDFAKYADFAFQTFGDGVRYWTTMNEPNAYCRMVYETGVMVPGNGSEPAGAYFTCIHNMLLAHGRTYRIYKQKYAQTQKGMVGMTVLSYSARAVDPTSIADVHMVDIVNMRALGHCYAPLIFGDYPEMLIATMEEERNRGKLPTSLLPNFTDDEKQMLTNSIDFLGLNVYMSFTVSGGKLFSSSDAKPRSDRADGGTDAVHDDRLPSESSDETYGSSSMNFECTAMTPVAMEATLSYAVNHLKNLPIIITENGCEDANGISDQNRAAYHSGYLRSMIQVIKDIGANVLGMTVWTLVDDFEWHRAYTPKMGLVHIDYTSPERTRTLKDSSEFFRKLVTERRVPLVQLRLELTTPQTTDPTVQTIPPTSHAVAPSTPRTSSQATTGSSRSALATRFLIATTFLLINLAL